jgi:hypothetical protein
MNTTRLESNTDPTARRNIRRPAITFAAGLIALAIATAVVLDPQGGRLSAGSDATTSSLVSPTAATTTAIDAAAPRFERSNEPAIEDSVNAHGG